MNFIELTLTTGKKVIGNINLLRTVRETENKKRAYVVGWNDIGGFEVEESYEEVITKINARIAGVNRIKLNNL